MTLFYVPLEPYESRYTMQWSAARYGWLERNWVKHRVDYRRIEGNATAGSGRTIKVGAVLDGVTRTSWGFSQTEKLIKLLVDGSITAEDSIFFDDFFHPGLEMVAYNMQLLGVRPGMYSFCHAQSVDEFDFTSAMKPWMRPLEKSFVRIYDKVFVNNDMLRDMCRSAWNASTIHNCGHVFSSEEVLERTVFKCDKKNEVVFASRFDTEKQPHLFMDLVEAYVQKFAECAPLFRICSGSPTLTSSLPSAVPRARELAKLMPKHFVISEGLSKNEYYGHLDTAKVIVNTSLQDWVSFVLLEGVTARCLPLFPRFRSFPEAFNEMEPYLYTPNDLDDMKWKLDNFLSLTEANHDKLATRFFDAIVKPHDETWSRHLHQMGITYAT